MSASDFNMYLDASRVLYAEERLWMIKANSFRDYKRDTQSRIESHLRMDLNLGSQAPRMTEDHLAALIGRVNNG